MGAPRTLSRYIHVCILVLSIAYPVCYPAVYWIVYPVLCPVLVIVLRQNLAGSTGYTVEVEHECP